jgi:hypothetical protein
VTIEATLTVVGLAFVDWIAQTKWAHDSADWFSERLTCCGSKQNNEDAEQSNVSCLTRLSAWIKKIGFIKVLWACKDVGLAVKTFVDIVTDVSFDGAGWTRYTIFIVNYSNTSCFSTAMGYFCMAMASDIAAEQRAIRDQKISELLESERKIFESNAAGNQVAPAADVAVEAASADHDAVAKNDDDVVLVAAKNDDTTTDDTNKNVGDCNDDVSDGGGTAQTASLLSAVPKEEDDTNATVSLKPSTDVEAQNVLASEKEETPSLNLWVSGLLFLPLMGAVFTHFLVGVIAYCWVVFIVFVVWCVIMAVGMQVIWCLFSTSILAKQKADVTILTFF